MFILKICWWGRLFRLKMYRCEYENIVVYQLSNCTRTRCRLLCRNCPSWATNNRAQDEGSLLDVVCDGEAAMVWPPLVTSDHHQPPLPRPQSLAVPLSCTQLYVGVWLLLTSTHFYRVLFNTSQYSSPHPPTLLHFNFWNIQQQYHPRIRLLATSSPNS